MHRLLFAALAVACAWPGSAAQAQSRTRIWDVQLGTPVSQLPLDEWVDPACGSNGAPPTLPLEGFADFARCPVERATGLREVWFIYDDEWEYIARARRALGVIARYSANTLDRQPIITSLLIDDGGRVQGYRVITDPRAPVDVRKDAYLLIGLFKGMFGAAPWNCSDQPLGDRERAIEGLFVKQSCEAVAAERLMLVETRYLLKAGQDPRDVARFAEEAAGNFESSARLEVYNLAAVTGAPCCQAYARP